MLTLSGIAGRLFESGRLTGFCPQISREIAPYGGKPSNIAPMHGNLGDCREERSTMFSITLFDEYRRQLNTLRASGDVGLTPIVSAGKF